MQIIQIAMIIPPGAHIAPQTARNLIVLGRAQNVRIAIHMTRADVVRARSRLACMALPWPTINAPIQSSPDAVLFWDSDVSLPDVDVIPAIARMLEGLKRFDIVGTPYSKKNEKQELPVLLLPDEMPDEETRWLKVGALPMGLTMISQACLLRMWEACAEFPMRDDFQGVVRDFRALFMLEFHNGSLLPEDYSFCFRARRLGMTCGLNVMHAADHLGEKLYTIDRVEDLAHD